MSVRPIARYPGGGPCQNSLSGAGFFRRPAVGNFEESIVRFFSPLDRNDSVEANSVECAVHIFRTRLTMYFKNIAMPPDCGIQAGFVNIFPTRN